MSVTFNAILNNRPLSSADFPECFVEVDCYCDEGDENCPLCKGTHKHTVLAPQYEINMSNTSFLKVVAIGKLALLGGEATVHEFAGVIPCAQLPRVASAIMETINRMGRIDALCEEPVSAGRVLSMGYDRERTVSLAMGFLTVVQACAAKGFDLNFS